MGYFKNLVVWNKSMELVMETYGICKKLPVEERYCLSDQMRRSAVSIPSNIAEGQSRGSDKEFVRFLLIARGSNAELETQILICIQMNYISEEESKKALELIGEIGKMLSNMIKNLS